MVNVVASYVDGVGHLIDAIQWDGTPETLANVKAWTKRAVVSTTGVLGVQTAGPVLNVGLNDWLVMDSNLQPQVFPMSNSQFAATYKTPTP